MQVASSWFAPVATRVVTPPVVASVTELTGTVAEVTAIAQFGVVRLATVAVRFAEPTAEPVAKPLELMETAALLDDHELTEMPWESVVLQLVVDPSE